MCLSVSALPCLEDFIGQDYGATSAGAYAVDHVTIWPTTDAGFAKFDPLFQNVAGVVTMSPFLYGSNSAPASPAAGTLLGIGTPVSATGTFPHGIDSIIGHAPITINSNDTVTAYRYVWVRMQVFFTMSGGNPTTMGFNNAAAQVQIFVATGTGTSGAGIDVEIIGPPLLYTSPVITWQLGAYSGTTGFPTCGCYASGRLWLGGAIANRFDASVSNGIQGSSVEFCADRSVRQCAGIERHFLHAQ